MPDDQDPNSEQLSEPETEQSSNNNSVGWPVFYNPVPNQGQGTTGYQSQSYNIQVPYPIQYIQLDLDIPSEAVEEEPVGYFCKRCKEHNEYAVANQPDKTFICYRCRNGF